MKKRPFNDSDIFTTFYNILHGVIEEIKSLDNDHILNNTIPALEMYYISLARIDPIQLFTDEYEMEETYQNASDLSRDSSNNIFSSDITTAPANNLRITIPYDGALILWGVQPSTSIVKTYPEIEIYEDRIILELNYSEDSEGTDRTKSEIVKLIRTISDTIANLNADVNTYNQNVAEVILKALQQRRKLAEESNKA